ncbi:MAG: monooxygenase [Pseudolabrys sp.]
MIVTVTTFHLKHPATLGEMTKVFQTTAPKYQGMPGLLRKNYWMSEDGLRVGGIYEWASRADADRAFTPDWKKFVESKYSTPPVIEYLHSPVMVDNREGTISVAARRATRFIDLFKLRLATQRVLPMNRSRTTCVFAQFCTPR